MRIAIVFSLIFWGALAGVFFYKAPAPKPPIPQESEQPQAEIRTLRLRIDQLVEQVQGHRTWMVQMDIELLGRAERRNNIPPLPLLEEVGEHNVPKKKKTGRKLGR